MVSSYCRQDRKMSAEITNKKLNILFVPSVYVGHVVAGLGLAQALTDRGHTVTYAVPYDRRKYIDNQCIQIETIDVPFVDDCGQTDAMPFLHKRLFNFQLTLDYLFVWFFFVTQPIRLTYKLFVKDLLLEKLIQKIKPDLIVLDDIIRFPSVINSGLPLVYLTSSHPRYFDPIEKFENITLSKHCFN